MDDYPLVPSLEHLALVKITTTLWNSIDVKGYLAKHSDDFDEAFPAMKNEVKKKVSELTGPSLLPASLKPKMENIVMPIGYQIALWKNFYTQSCGLEIDLPDKLFWTSEGTIDERKTAEELIKNGNLNITTRYKLACHYCLENDVRQLWNELPQSEKELYYNEEAHKKIEKQTLITFWTYNINGQLSKLNDMVGELTSQRSTLYQYVFEQAAIARNIVATKYFLKKLSPTQRKMSLETALDDIVDKRIDDGDDCNLGVPDDDFNNIICFLISKMGKEQRMELNPGYSGLVLGCFLDWPWQSSFVKTAGPMLPYIYEKDYEQLLYAMLCETVIGRRDYNSLKFFLTFWQESYKMTRRYATYNVCNSLLTKLSELTDSDVRLLFRKINLGEIKEYIISDAAVDTLETCITHGAWKPMEIFIHESISRKVISKNELQTLRDKIKRQMNSLVSELAIKEVCASEKFLEKLDGLLKTMIVKEEQRNRMVVKRRNLAFKTEGNDSQYGETKRRKTSNN